MYAPVHLSALGTAAQHVIERLNEHRLLVDHYPGYLVVQKGTCGQVLLLLHVGPAGIMCPDHFAEDAKIRNQVVLNRSDDARLPVGTTSSDTDFQRAGSVTVSGLVIGYASIGGGIRPLGDEAIAITIAIKAGILTKSAVKKRYCNTHIKEYSAALDEIIDAIS